MRLKKLMKCKDVTKRRPFCYYKDEEGYDIKFCTKITIKFNKELVYNVFKWDADAELPDILKKGKYAGKFFRQLKKHLGLSYQSAFEKSLDLPNQWVNIDMIDDLLNGDCDCENE